MDDELKQYLGPNVTVLPPALAKVIRHLLRDDATDAETRMGYELMTEVCSYIFSPDTGDAP